MTTPEEQQRKPNPEFDDFADRYDQLLADPLRDRFGGPPVFFHQRKLDLLLAHLRHSSRRPGQLEWLDFGCGIGDLLRLGQTSFAGSYGCDISAESLKHCQGITVKVQDSPDSIPFPDRSFDVVTAACVFHHVEPEQRSLVMKSMYRVLKPGGSLYLFEHNPWNPVTRLIVKRSPIDVNAILLSSQEGASLFRGCGLTVEAVRYYLFFPQTAGRFGQRIESYLSRLPLGGQYAVIGSKQ